MKKLLKQAAVEICSHAPLKRVICWRAPPNRRHVALTFDDGPDPTYTPQVLDLLAAQGLKATFFVLGSHVERHPQVLQRIVAAGHDIGMHGYTHDLTDIAAQILRTRALLSRFGATSTLFRPPYGILGARTGWWVLRHGLSTVMWSVDGRDSMRYRGVATMHDPYEEIDAGDIVLLHDDNPVCITDLAIIVEMLRRKRLSAVRVSEMLSS